MPKEIILDKNKYGDTKIALALSGGRDSVALAVAMSEAGFNFFAVNVEHGIRGESSLRDSRFVADFCKQRNIKLKTFSVDAPEYSVKTGYTLEQAARELRYNVFESLLSAGECEAVALAHHSGDQTETVLMNIFRGTGLKGLGGMKEVNGAFIRPFLKYSREDIDYFIKTKNLPYVEDETNSDTAYTRNFLRQELETLRQRFPGVDESIARLSRNAAEADDYIEKKSADAVLKDNEAYISADVFKERVTGARTIFKACHTLGVFQDIEERHINLLFDFADASNGKVLELPHGLCAHKQEDYIVISKNVNERPVPKGALLPVLKSEIKYGKGTLFADAAKIPPTAVFRYRKDGDYIDKFGGGRKSLGDFLTDKKVPLRKRDSLLLLANGNEVLAVLGLDISSSIKIDGETESAVKITDCRL